MRGLVPRTFWGCAVGEGALAPYFPLRSEVTHIGFEKLFPLFYNSFFFFFWFEPLQSMKTKCVIGTYNTPYGDIFHAKKVMNWDIFHAIILGRFDKIVLI